ncbi:MAG: hypothetical protein DRI57_17895, partial [Deltaproteobacteria bacterium]
ARIAASPESVIIRKNSHRAAKNTKRRKAFPLCFLCEISGIRYARIAASPESVIIRKKIMRRSL